MPRTFNIANFGCRASQADGAGIAAELARRGLQRASDASVADVVVVNTCTVTAEADRDARQTIRRIHRENPSADIVVTGCYAQRQPDDLAALDGVTWVVGNSHKHEIGGLVQPKLVQIESSEPRSITYHGGIDAAGILVGDIASQANLAALPGVDGLGRSRPNVKVQDGCHNRCSFCIIPSVRGGSRSIPADTVVKHVQHLEGSFPEIVLTGINLGRWGRDLDSRPRFARLLEQLLARTSVPRFRLSSVEPMDWSDELLRLMSTSSRIAKHMHIPLQSGSDPILRRMRRRYRARHYESRVTLGRRLMPDAAIGADVMVGFPGETDEDFEATRSFVARMPFTYLHVFSFSIREGTEAASMASQIPRTVKRERSRVLRELIDRKNLAFRQGLAGKTLSAVTLSSSGSSARALTDNFVDVELPEVSIPSGSLVDVRVESVEGRRTIATLCG